MSSDLPTWPSYLVRPEPLDPRLSSLITGVDQTGAPQETRVIHEKPLTLYLNAQEIVTMMTIGDHPEELAIGYLLNQGMLKAGDEITGVDVDEELDVVVVRTGHATNFEGKLKKRTQTSGCAQGTAFGDLMEAVEGVTLPRAEVRTSWLYALSHRINTTPSLYLEAGAIHGCVLCRQDEPLIYMEDVGRHNAIDKIAGYMFRHGIEAADKIFYTTGRLTSEMVIKTVRMGIPVLASRSGFTAWGVELARKAGLTLIGRMRGKRFLALAGAERIVFDQDLAFVEEEAPGTAAKGPAAMIDAGGVLGVLLAGGLARRMGGGDKPLKTIGGVTILDHVIGRAQPQCAGLILNANGDASRFARWGLPVVPDGLPDFPGPLAGILAGLDWAADQRPEITHAVSIAADTPFIPRDLVTRLVAGAAAAGTPLACAASGGWTHPVIGLWPISIRAALRQALTADNERKIDRFTARFGCVSVEWGMDPIDPFFNANEPTDLEQAEALFARGAVT